jgi:hypothetical protein
MLSFNKSPNDKNCVTTLSDFRRIALSMPETEELNGMGYPNFRTGRKSFAIIEDTMAVIRLTRDQQATFVATAPEVFAPDSSGWGRLGNTVIRLEVADEATVQVAVATAWSNVAVVGNASEVVDVAGAENTNEFVHVAEVVDVGDATEAENVGIGDATEVNTTVVKVVNAGEVAEEASAAALVNLAAVVEVGDPAEVADEIGTAEVADEVSSAASVNVAEVTEIENVTVNVEPDDHLLSVIERLKVSWER